MSYHQGPALGVDLGTTFTAAALSRQGRAEPVTLGSTSVAIPSVAFLTDSADLTFGTVAARRSATDPGRVAREFKRRVGDPAPVMLGNTPFAAEMLMARMLASVVEQVSTTEGRPPATLAVTHPANWGEYKLDLFRQAIRHVELDVGSYIPEPVAAATFYASQRDLDPGTLVAVYDLGGGTFDAALVRSDTAGFEIVGQPDGLERLGGIDVDHAVLQHVTQTLGVDLAHMDQSDPALTAAVGQLRAACVEAKEALSAETDVSIPVMLPNLHTEVRLTRSELEDMVRPTLDESLVALRRAITSTGHSPADVSAVLLVGGASRMPLVGEMVSAGLGRPIAVDARPKDAISMGAAIAAAQTEVSPAPAPAPPGPAVPPMAPVTSGQTPADAATGNGTAPAAGRRRPVLVAAAALVAIGLVGLVGLAAFMLTGDDGDDEQTVDSASDTSDGEVTTTLADPPTTTIAADTDPLGGIDVTDILGDGGGGGSGVAVEGSGMSPLPGSDWSDEARAHWVDECDEVMSSSAAGMGASVDPSATCGCLYDEMEASSVTFAEFDAWVTAEEADETTEAANAVADASMMTCIMSGIDI